MSTVSQQVESFRFITFRSAGQTFALPESVVICTQKAATLMPATATSAEGSVGTLEYDQEQIPVYRVAEYLGVKDRSTTGIVQSIIVQSTNGRLVLQARDVSEPLTLPYGNYLSLPPPLDRLVGNRYLAILKWPLVQKDLVDKQLSERFSQWRARRVEHQDELYLLLNVDQFLGCPTQNSPECSNAAESEAIDELLSYAEKNCDASKTAFPVENITSGDIAPATRPASKLRLVLFAPTPDKLGERPYMFGISATQVMEVCRPLPIIAVPGAEKGVLGVVNWRGTVVPVMRMAELVGLEGIRSSQVQRLLIALAPNGEQLIAVQVLANMRTQDLPIGNTPQPLSRSESSRYLHGSYELEDETLIMPDLKSIMQFA